MNKYNLLDCTLRDGGYITSWRFQDEMIKETVQTLLDAKLDFIEVGYLNKKAKGNNTTQFSTIEEIEKYIPPIENRNQSLLLAMADVQQFGKDNLTEYTGKSIDGIRVVFYKHQIEEAIDLALNVKKYGYKLLMQPMVTIDYTVDEYASLAARINKLQPYAVSIVDSFGYMEKEDFRKYFRILDNILEPDIAIGFHSHNNMDLALLTAQDIIDYSTARTLILDCSLYGMGRGAGNLNTELIANYYNNKLGVKYNIALILKLIGKHVLPIANERKWGYSPYLFLTAFYHYHPNFACYLLDEYPDVTVEDFETFLLNIPNEMKTKCKKDYVIKMWKNLIGECR